MLKTLFFGTFLTIIVTLGTYTEKKYALLIFLSLSIIYTSEGSYNLCFILGVLLAYLRYNLKVWELYIGKMCTFVSVILLVSGIYLHTYWITIFGKGLFSDTDFYGGGDAVFYNIVGSFMVILSLMGLGNVRKIISKSHILRFVGKISFAIYLLHYPIICSLSCWLYIFLHNFIMDENKILSVVFIITTIVLCVGAKLFYEVIEKSICNKLTSKICAIYFES